MSSIRHWLWLSTRGATPGPHTFRLLKHFGDPEKAYFADEAEYALADVPAKVRESLRNKSFDQVEKILNDCERLGIRILTWQDADYPERLRQIEDPPCVLYVKGNLPRMDEEAAVAIVGARKASPYGVSVAGKLGLDLARQGALIVSGSAWGIDSSALKGALKGGGKVVSVLGNGIDVVYPTGNEDLYADVAVSGALVSEYPPGTEPAGKHFPYRNRIIAGLSLGVVVVEGGANSGSLITARWALDQDRDVFAVPGNIDAELSRGPNGLIHRSEAKLIRDAWDILDEYETLYPAKLHPRAPLSPESEQGRLAGIGSNAPVVSRAKAEKREEPEEPEEPKGLIIDLNQDPEAFTDDEGALLKALQGDVALTADELVEKTGIPARRVLSALTMLQIRQLVQEGTGKRFSTQVIVKD